MIKTIRSVLVHEETDEHITLRAASEKGTIASAIGFWWTLWRHDWLPHRWYEFGDLSEFPDKPSRSGWRWHGHNFRTRSHAASD